MRRTLKHKKKMTIVESGDGKRDVTAEICRGMKDWKEYLETGKSDYFRPAEELLHELQNPNR